MSDGTSLQDRAYFNKFHASDNKDNGGSSGGGGGSGMFDGAVNEAKAMMEAASKAAVELAIAQSKFQIANKGGENTQSLTR